MPRQTASLIILIVVSSVWRPVGAEHELSGFLESYHAARVSNPQDLLISRSRLRLGLFLGNDELSAFASVDASYNYVVEDRSGFGIREAYVDYRAEAWDLRVGRQIIVWGVADGIAVTDIVSPWNLSEFLTQEIEDIRIPVEAVRARLLLDGFTLETIWIPVFQPSTLPPEDGPWAIGPQVPTGVTPEWVSALTPPLKLENGEFGARLIFNFSGLDLGVAGLYTWDDFPTYHRSVRAVDGVTHLRLQPEHHRVGMLGLDFSLPLGPCILRGEVALFLNRHLEAKDPLAEELFERHTLDGLLGVDWMPGGDWIISAQVYDRAVLSYADAMKMPSHHLLATLSISKQLLRQKLKVSAQVYLSITGLGCFLRSSIDYALSDGFHLRLGLDVFAGSEGIFGRFDNNDEVWLQAKFSF